MATFTLAADQAAPFEGDVLGVWRQQGSVDQDAEPAVTTTPVWKVEVGAEVSVAQWRLAVGRSRLDEATRALPAVATRLDRVLSEPATAAYEAGGPRARPSPEEELRQSVKALNGPSEMPAFSFSAPSSTAWWQPRVDELARFARRVRSWCSPTAWVETTAEDGYLARSRLAFGGDLATVWHCHRRVDSLLHEESVKLVMATRTTLVRAVALATHGALGLGVRLSNPATAVLAIPATWRFVQSVADEIRRSH